MNCQHDPAIPLGVTPTTYWCTHCGAIRQEAMNNNEWLLPNLEIERRAQ